MVRSRVPIVRAPVSNGMRLPSLAIGFEVNSALRTAIGIRRVNSQAFANLKRRQPNTFSFRKAGGLIAFRHRVEGALSIEKSLKQRAVSVVVDGRYTLPNWFDPQGRPRSFACRTSRVSPFRMMVAVPVVGKVG